MRRSCAAAARACGGHLQLFLQLSRMKSGFAVHSPAAAHSAQASFVSAQGASAAALSAKPFAANTPWMSKTVGVDWSALIFVRSTRSFSS